MKYESTILKRLIDTYGVVGNPRYISEIIKEFIVRGKERFPELFTYQADWLAHIDEFGLNPSYTVRYTGQSIYAPNTLERPVKSAILTGQTLVNQINDTSFEDLAWTKYNYESVENGVITFVGNGQKLVRYAMHKTPVKKNQTYTAFVKIKSDCANVGIELETNDGDTYIRSSNYTTSETNDFVLLKAIITVKNHNTLTFVLRATELINGNVYFKEPILLEGDYTNQEIPFFSGMQSVRMPVLTTSNEDGTKTNILTVNDDVTLRSNGNVYDELDLLTGKLTQRIDEDGEVLAKEVIKTVDLTIHDKDQQKVEQLTSFDGGTHFTTTSQEGSLLPTLTVDVVTDLEETLKLCSTDGNTL